MKYVLLLGDGMADTPVPSLNGRTPLQAARHPHMDRLAQAGDLGLAKTIPDGMPTGSDTANMACMGFDPKAFYSGRSPLEAVSMGVALAEDDVAFRCNLVNVSGDFPDATMVDYSSDEITTPEARELISALAPAFAAGGAGLYGGAASGHQLPALLRAVPCPDRHPRHPAPRHHG